MTKLILMNVICCIVGILSIVSAFLFDGLTLVGLLVAGLACVYIGTSRLIMNKRK